MPEGVTTGSASPWMAVIVLLLLAATLFLFAPRTVWEFDEPLFSMALTDPDPARHLPPPPGYPVYIPLGALVSGLAGDSFRALVFLSIGATLLGFFLLSRAITVASGLGAVGAAGAALFYFSPTMLIHGSVAMSDPAALALLALTLLCAVHLTASREPPSRDLLIAFAAAASVTVGVRPQTTIAVLPLLAVMLLWIRPMRSRGLVLAVFTGVCLLWFAPFVISLGGVGSWWRWEADQASYFAQHDAALSRSGREMGQIAIRFLAHAWGPKTLSIPILALAALGFGVSLLRRRRVLIPLLAVAVPYFGFAIAFMDPADAARYSLPGQLTMAFFAALGLGAIFGRFLPSVALIAALIWGGFAFAYTWPVLRARSRSAAPPVAAAQHIVSTLPEGSVVLYELPLWPHARYLLADRYTILPVMDGLRLFGDRPDLQMVMFTDGDTEREDAAVFAWPWTDAYGKLTRNHYRVASVIPMSAGDRFVPGEGVYAPERTPDGWAWHWLAERAEIILPATAGSTAELRFKIPNEAPFDFNELAIDYEGIPFTVFEVKKGEIGRVLVPAGRIQLTAARSYVPAEIPGTLQRDQRRLSVMLLSARVIE